MAEWQLSSEKPHLMIFMVFMNITIGVYLYFAWSDYNSVGINHHGSNALFKKILGLERKDEDNDDYV